MIFISPNKNSKWDSSFYMNHNDFRLFRFCFRSLFTFMENTLAMIRNRMSIFASILNAHVAWGSNFSHLHWIIHDLMIIIDLVFVYSNLCHHHSSILVWTLFLRSPHLLYPTLTFKQTHHTVNAFFEWWLHTENAPCVLPNIPLWIVLCSN